MDVAIRNCCSSRVKTASSTCLPYSNTLIRKLFRAHCTQSNEIVINSIVVAVCYEMFYVYIYDTNTFSIALFVGSPNIVYLLYRSGKEREHVCMPIN